MNMCVTPKKYFREDISQPSLKYAFSQRSSDITVELLEFDNEFF